LDQVKEKDESLLNDDQKRLLAARATLEATLKEQEEIQRAIEVRLTNPFIAIKATEIKTIRSWKLKLRGISLAERQSWKSCIAKIFKKQLLLPRPKSSLKSTLSSRSLLSARLYLPPSLPYLSRFPWTMSKELRSVRLLKFSLVYLGRIKRN